MYIGYIWVIYIYVYMYRGYIEVMMIKGVGIVRHPERLRDVVKLMGPCYSASPQTPNRALSSMLSGSVRR